MNVYFELLRLNEWYKNITVLIGIIFAYFLLGHDFDLFFLLKVILIIFLSCLISSANYVLNAVTDRDYDKKHLIKRLRPLPSKRVSVKKAYFFMILLLLIPLIISYFFLNKNVAFALLLLFIAGIFYNLKPIRLKDVPYVDVLSESINNPIRFLAGWFIVSNTLPDLFLLILVWFLGCFLMTKKRIEELKKYKRNAKVYRRVFRYYSLKSLNSVKIFYGFLSLIITLILVIRWV